MNASFFERFLFERFLEDPRMEDPPMEDPQMQPITEKAFVIQRIDAGEREVTPAIPIHPAA